MRQRIPFRSIGIAEAEGLLRRNDVVVLDVRDAKAFAAAHIDGAQNVSTANLLSVIGEAATSRPLVVYCYHGHASREYAQILSDIGCPEVYSLDGGYEAWRNRPAPDEPLRRWLAEHGFDDVNAVIGNDTTPLMTASHRGNGDAVRLLIASGANVSARNADGNNALWLACVGQHPDVIDMLVEAGIDIDNRNDAGATPLMYAASSGDAGAVERLLAHGADMTRETLDGFTALDLAATAE